MHTRLLAVLGCLALVATTLCVAGDVRVSHLYELSDFNGIVPYSDVILHADRHHDEVYAVYGNDVRVFNAAGMEIYRFQHDRIKSKIRDLVVDENGDILTLNFDPASTEARAWWITRADYRGDLTGRIDPRNLPAEIEPFTPERMFYHDGQFVLVAPGTLQVVVVDRSGVFRRHHDLTELLEIDDPESKNIDGVSVDRSGNLLFTIPVLFRAYVLAPDSTIRQFGTSGSGPGKFGVVSGIVGGDQGHIMIADKLRGVVMVFDASLRFVTEFSGNRKWSLSRPTVLAIGNSGRLYVTQSRERGVAVLGLSPVSDDSTSDVGSSLGNSERQVVQNSRIIVSRRRKEEHL